MKVNVEFQEPDKKKKIFEIISRIAGWLLSIMAWDLYNKRDIQLKELEEITKDSGLAWTNKQTNDCLSLLNKNIIELNCSTSVYSRILTILTFFILVLTVLMIIKG